MSLYRTVTVKAKLTGNRISVSPSVSRSSLNAKAEIVNRTTVSTTSDYNALQNKPQIESVALIGDKSFSDLGLSNITNMRLEQLLTI